MTKFAIIADATCDLGKEMRERNNIHIVPGHLCLPDKSEVLMYPEWSLFTKEEFYKTLKKDPNSFSTSPANVAEFEQTFESFAVKGMPVLAISISSGISGAYRFMQMARKQVLERHPDAQIRCVDSLRFGPGFGLLVLKAAALREQGMTLDEAAAYLEANRTCVRQAGWLDDLSFVAAKGRINHAQAFFGTLAGVKPIGEFDQNGLTTVLTKVKGAKTAYAVMLDYIEATVIDPESQTVLIAQTDRYKQALEYKAMIEERFHPKEVIICDVHPLCGVNIGPGLMAAYYFGKPISQDLTEEKQLMNDITSR